MVAENGRDELAEIVRRVDQEYDPDYEEDFWQEKVADAILSSSWLAGQLKQARAGALEEAAAELKYPASGATYEMWSSDVGSWLKERARKDRVSTDPAL